MLRSFGNRIRASLTVRIFLITSLILIAACAVTYGFIAWATPLSYQSIAADNISERLDELVGELRNVPLEDSGPLFDSFILDTGTSVTVTDQEGAVVDLPISVALAGAQGASLVETTITSDSVDISISEGEGDLYSVTEISPSEVNVGWKLPFALGGVAISSSEWQAPITFGGKDEGYQLAVTSSITAVNRTAEAMEQVLPYLILIILVISLLGALFYSRYITRPIVRLSGISQRMAELDFSWECREKRQDEIGLLGRNLDELSQRLSTALAELQTANEALQADIDREREMERQRSAFFAAASHELKTPVTVLKGQLSGMLGQVDVYQDRDKYLARSLAVTGRMEKLVQEMLTVSRMEQAGSLIRREPVDLSSLVESLVEQTEDLALQKEQTITTDIGQGLAVQGDETLLGRAIGNLLTNALTYSPSGSRVRVGLWAEGEGPVLSVENSGVHIPDEALPHLFEAFYRVEGSRNRETGGSGLGLYLVKIILDRHQAECEICNTESGVRAVVRWGRPIG